MSTLYLNLKEEAKKLIEKEKWILAHNILIEMQQIAPNNYQLIIKLGNVYEKLGNFIAAQWYYKKAIKLQQNNDFGYFNLGKLYLNRKEYTKAREILIKCLTIDDAKAVTNFYYGQLLYKMNMISQSFYHYCKAADIRPNISNYQFFAGKTALILNTSSNDIIANNYLTKAIQLTNKSEIKYINEYVMHWRKWPWNVNLLSIQETIHYLFLYAVNSNLNKAQKEYVNLCIYALKNEKNFPDKYKLKCIDKALQFNAYNDRLLYEKYKILDKQKYGICNSKNIISRKLMCDSYEHPAWNPFSLFDETETQCKLIINGYISHNNLNINKLLIIPYEIQKLCLKYLIGTKYLKLLLKIDKFYVSNKLQLYNNVRIEMREIIFDSIFPSMCNKIIYKIIKLLDYIYLLISCDSMNRCIHNIGNRIDFDFSFGHFLSLMKCECKYNCILCSYYILYLLSFISITDLYLQLIKLDKSGYGYCEKLILLPFKLIMICHKPLYEPIRIAFEFITKLIISNDKFYEIYYNLLFYQKKLSKHKILSKLCILPSDWQCSISTMRFIVSPLLFGQICSPIHKPLIIPIVNINLLEDLICNNLNFGHRNHYNKYQISLNWLQLELKQINDLNININMDNIVYQMWMYLIRKPSICDSDCNVLKTFINKGIYLKPKDISWVAFYEIINNPFILSSAPFVNILMYYCFCQMAKDEENKDDWQHCVSLLSLNDPIHAL